MGKRGYKLQEFMAQSANVNCIKIGKKTRRHFITGGDDEIVNIWSIGKPTSITSLSGHTSPIESVAFDSTEVLVAAGASSGVVKLWDLEETKVVRTLNGHRSYCTAVEFHPFGDFFASGSMDTNLKIWDIRKKRCIHTYKSHKRAISTIRFTPDGRWVVSGGLDNVVKIWDLTAGKLLHEFKFHEGHIRSMDFHPLEFLLATGSSDKTVKFWDLETFELIGSTRPEATGVRSITFHPDGRTLFCGLDSSLQVYSWEPVFCHDAVDIGWSTLGDLCINDGKLLGCSYYQNSIGIWAADVSKIEPYGHNLSAKENTHVEPKSETTRRSFIPSDDDTKDIKNIYVDNKAAGMTLKLTSTQETDVSLKPPNRRRPSNTKFDREEEISTSVEPVMKSGSDTATNRNFQRRLFADDVAKDCSADRTPTSTCVADEFHKFSPPTILPKESVVLVNGRTRSLVEKFEKGDNLDTNSECCKPDLTTQIIPNTDNTPTTTIQQSVNVVSCAIFPEATTSPIPVTIPDILPCVQPLTKSKTSQIPSKTPELVPSCTIPEAKTSQMLVKTPEKAKASPIQRSVASRHEKIRPSQMLVARKCRDSSHKIPERTRTEKPKFSPLLEDNQQTTGRHLASKNDNVAEVLTLDHDLSLRTLRSRLTKLQAVRHFWEQNDMKGAINALQKLRDHAVQADVISVMLENIESLTLDLFSSLLPLLLGLLNSETERHINVSLEMLLKLVAVFDPMINTRISAPSAVGVDLHAEKRLESCNQCHVLLQKIHKTLPNVIRRGGLTAKSAQELNLILQQS